MLGIDISIEFHNCWLTNIANPCKNESELMSVSTWYAITVFICLLVWENMQLCNANKNHPKQDLQYFDSKGGVYSPFPVLLIMSNLISERHFCGIPKEESRGFMNESAVLLYYEINFLVTDFARVCFLPKLVGIRDLFHFLIVLVYFSY